MGERGRGAQKTHGKSPVSVPAPQKAMTRRRQDPRHRAGRPTPGPTPGAWGDGGVLCGQSQARLPKTQGGLPTGNIKCYLKGRRI